MGKDNERIKRLLSKARSLPLLPGVYLMKNSDGTVIYVGKAKALRNRVSNYFSNLSSHNAKTVKLISHIEDFEYIRTENETEAFVLENELIKLHRPRYNIDLKDDKSYPYLALTDEAYPRLKLVRSYGEDKKENYFGPYTSGGVVREIIDTASQAFKLPTCTKKLAYGKRILRPCLNYHLGRCRGYCMGEISESEYKDTVDALISFLKSDYSDAVRSMKEEMEEAAENLNFEKAALLRDRISALRKLKEKQKIVGSEDLNCDAFGVYSDDGGGAIAVMEVRNGRLRGMESKLFGAEVILDSESFLCFVADYYKRCDFPQSVLLPAEFEKDIEMFEKGLGDNTKILFPKRGEKYALLTMAEENASEKVKLSRKMFEKNERVLVSLASLLSLEVVPETIEAYDVSNTGDDYITCGLISIKKGKLNKSGYRTFNIKREGQDDYASMREAVSRRVDRALAKDEAFPLPDLILLDGGKGHVCVIKSLLKEKGVYVPVFGMVKDEYHKTRSLTDGEGEVSIAKNGEIFGFIYKIQEEVHRFSLSRMDKRRRKGMLKSSLTDIPGIGTEKAKILMKNFGTIGAIKNATIDDLSSVKGINKNDALNIFEYYNKEKGE